MDTKEALDQYLSKDTRISEKDIGNGNKEVCDLDTGECYVISVSDGLIERVDNTKKINKTLRVETPEGIKTLLTG